MNLARRSVTFLLFVITFLSQLALAASAQQIDPKTYGGMKWRLIGPFRGGRVLAVTGVPSQPNTYYFGATGGGSACAVAIFGAGRGPTSA